jgi:uncharacterized membrane protein
MWTLALACAFFLCIHMMISGTILKQQLVTGLGPRTYGLLFSLLSIFGLMWMIHAYDLALEDPQNTFFWRAPFWLKIVGFITNFIAINLIVIGYLSPSPTKLYALKRTVYNPVSGIIRVTRHPVLAGIAIFSLTHGISNGNMASFVMFGSILALCILGANSIDMKRVELMGDKYRMIMKRTSIVPFLAIMQGRTPFEPHEVGVMRLMFAVSTFTVIVVLHEILFRLSAL